MEMNGKNQYFKKTDKYWVLNDNDYDYRGQHELKEIAPIITSQGTRNQFIFTE